MSDGRATADNQATRTPYVPKERREPPDSAAPAPAATLHAGGERTNRDMSDDQRITQLLEAVNAGDDGAMDDLMDAVYTDLKGVAERHMAQQFGRNLPGVTLEPAALVNESFLRLIRQRNAYANRGQFFAIATKVMLRVLVDYQRQRSAAKRGGGKRAVTLQIDVPALPGGGTAVTRTIELGTLTGALQELDTLDSRKADVVRLRVVWGLQMKEIAESLDVSLATVERDWAFAKAWLARAAVGETQAAAAGDPDS
jgi:RNA polymerase sigma-70 factor (ECF subfamily)